MSEKEIKSPDFFEENVFDPIKSATGRDLFTKATHIKTAGVDKKRKAGYYLSVKVLDRFNRKYHELKLNGISIDNKSDLLEKVLLFALDDIDKGTESTVLKRL